MYKVQPALWLVPIPQSCVVLRGPGNTYKEERQALTILASFQTSDRHFCAYSLILLAILVFPPLHPSFLASPYFRSFPQRPPSSQPSATLPLFFTSSNNCPKTLSQRLPQVILHDIWCLEFLTPGKVAPQSPQENVQRIKGAELEDHNDQKI